VLLFSVSLVSIEPCTVVVNRPRKISSNSQSASAVASVFVLRLHSVFVPSICPQTATPTHVDGLLVRFLGGHVVPVQFLRSHVQRFEFLVPTTVNLRTEYIV
jgi:hypothetical protein